MDHNSKLDVNASYSKAFALAGMRWAKYLVVLGALKRMMSGMLVGAMGQGWYTTQIVHMSPPYLALIHPKTGTPVYVMLLITSSSACLAFFSSLDVPASVCSINTLFIFMLIAVALLVRRYYARNVTPKSNLVMLAVLLALIIGSSIDVSESF